MEKVRIIKKQVLSSLFVLVFLLCGGVANAAENEGKSSSMQMMERVEMVVYGEAGKGGLIDRLNTLEKELFGRSLPGSISERHTAILNFLEVGTADQPSMLFKLGVAEWIVRQAIQPDGSALKRVESLEKELDGEMQYGKPVAMRVERILATLVADPVTFQEAILPTATVLKAKFLEELGPATSKKGDSVKLVLADDLFVDKILVAPRGSFIDTRVREVKQPRAFGVPGQVLLEFRSLVPLGPQQPPVTVGDASKKATEEAQKGKDKGESGIIGAAGASIGGAVLLGPVGLIGGALVRGNAVKIPEGSVTFVETSGDVRISGWPVPESLHIDPNATIKEGVVPTTTTTTTITTTTTTHGTGTGGRETIELPPEQKIN
ncbi:MAG: hypothetical protein LBR61_11225 [Synergistaceae bacterium]|nr:hypothetical protein [Synergistaceae bacterium]